MDPYAGNRPKYQTRRKNLLNKKASVKIPPFHYTQSQERRIWTCTIYPHAEIFLRLPGSIKWSDWSYKQGDTTASYNSTPYYALGGAVEEVYSMLYKRDIPRGEELHERVDPTGDLDVRICPLRVTVKGGHKPTRYYTEPYHRSSDSIVLHPWFEDAVNWLVDQIVAYFKPHERKLNVMFPTARPFIKDYDTQCKNARRIERVGPLTIIHTTHLNGNTALTKVQVKLTIPKPDIISRAATKGQARNRFTNDVIQDHMVEFGFWEHPFENTCAHQSIVYRPYNLRLRDLKGEVAGCFTGLESRLELIYHPGYIHKAVNYLYRLRFLLTILYSLWKKSNTKNAGLDEDTLYHIGQSIETLLESLYTAAATHGQHRTSIWLMFFEIALLIKAPLRDYVDMERIQTRVDVFTDYLYRQHAHRYANTDDKNDIQVREFSQFMSEMQERYFFNPPIGCDEATPAEMPLVEEEKRRRNAEPPPPRGFTLAQIANLPELEREEIQEQRRVGLALNKKEASKAP